MASGWEISFEAAGGGGKVREPPVDAVDQGFL